MASDGKTPSHATGYGAMQCMRCKRLVSSIKLFHFRKSLCTYCYDITHTTIPCLDCFQDIEIKCDSTQSTPSICNICKAQRAAQLKRDETDQTRDPKRNKTPNKSRALCSRTSFACSSCASVHTLRCPHSHYSDLNISSRTRRQRYANVQTYRSSECENGFYFWHKFLFCSRACVKRRFQYSPQCAICGMNVQESENMKLARCRRCLIPLCAVCSSAWFTDGCCTQCFVDSHPEWTDRQLHLVITQTRMENYKQIFIANKLNQHVAWVVAGFLSCRY